MAFRRFVIPIVLFVLVAGIAIGTLTIADAASDEAARTAENVTNETINQQVDVWQYVNRSLDDSTAGFNESITAYNNTGVELTKGTDYQWNATDGTIKYENTPRVNDNTNGNVSYTYFENTQNVNALSAIIDPLVLFVSQTPLLIGGLALGVILLAAAGILSKYVGDSGPKTNR